MPQSFKSIINNKSITNALIPLYWERQGTNKNVRQDSNEIIPKSNSPFQFEPREDKPNQAI